MSAEPLNRKTHVKQGELFGAVSSVGGPASLNARFLG